MNGYLGETVLEDLSHTEFKDYTKVEWALYFASVFGQVDGSHHKAQAIDLVVQVLNDTPVVVSLAKWEDGTEEYRIRTSEPSQKYLEFIKNWEDGEDGPNTYEWDRGF